MGLADTERNRAAVHEAGHALVAAARGLGVAVIELHGFDGDGGTQLSDKPQELDRVWVLYGGPFAEKVVFRKWQLAAITPELDELLMAHGLCQKMGIHNTHEIMDQVERYLREHQDRLELIATRLLETNTLHGAELDGLLGQQASSAPRPTARSARWETVLSRRASAARMWRRAR